MNNVFYYQINHINMKITYYFLLKVYNSARNPACISDSYYNSPSFFNNKKDKRQSQGQSQHTKNYQHHRNHRHRWTYDVGTTESKQRFIAL